MIRIPLAIKFGHGWIAASCRIGFVRFILGRATSESDAIRQIVARCRTAGYAITDQDFQVTRIFY